jgi:transcriptional regulator GlxA family with amidase domain
MGCTATQWIRSSRLELAHKKIMMGSSNDSVASIALACGYRSMGLFSIEFQQRFHVKPSHLLRSAQSNMQCPIVSDDKE